MDALPAQLHNVLGPDEQALVQIKQKMYHAKTIESIVITNNRILLLHPYTAGLDADYTEYNYRDISSVSLSKRVIGSTIRCILKTGKESLLLNDLPNSEAERAYEIIRAHVHEAEAPLSS